MTTIVKFVRNWYPIREAYHSDNSPGIDRSGEYVPLTEYQALKSHAELLAKETYELKGLLRRVNEIGPKLTDTLKWSNRKL